MKKETKKKIKNTINAIIFNPLFQWILAIIAALFIWFIYLTSSIRFKNYTTFKKYRKSPAIFVFWHGRTLMLPPIVCVGGMRGYVVASGHRDGRIMAHIQRLFGLRIIYGSSTRGGVSVLRQGISILRNGRFCIALSPDGPSGPSMRFHDGALYFAKMTGAPIIPVCISASRGKMLNNWDKYLIPYPFSKITCNIGNPIFVGKDTDVSEFDKIKNDIENIMVNQLREMDNEFNWVPIPQDVKASALKRERKEARAAKKAARKIRKSK